jgi:hypothetical protein
MATKSSDSSTSQPDWSNYDFRTWDPSKVPAGAAATVMGTAFRSVLVSPDWPTNLSTGVTGVKQVMLPGLNAYAASLQQKLNSLDGDLAAATSAAQQQMSKLQESMRVAATPAQPTADPAYYQVAAKVLDQSAKVSLPGVQVRVLDSRNPNAALASGTSDLAGNVVLKLTQQQIEALGSTHSGASEPPLVLQVVSPSGKQLFSASLCPKLNQVETVVAGIASTPELSQHLDLAQSVASQDQLLLRSITTHIDALRIQTAQAKSNLQQELQQVQGMIADLQ